VVAFDLAWEQMFAEVWGCRWKLASKLLEVLKPRRCRGICGWYGLNDVTVCR
jgi:hypothetical protein